MYMVTLKFDKDNFYGVLVMYLKCFQTTRMAVRVCLYPSSLLETQTHKQSGEPSSIQTAPHNTGSHPSPAPGFSS